MLHGQFATRREEAKYPTLWDGRVLGFCPSVTGPTGLTMYDLSGRSNNSGTLTDTDPATAWTLSRGQYAFSPDGVNDYVVQAVGLGLTGNPTFSISGWFFFPSDTERGLLGWGNTGVALEAAGLWFARVGSQVLSAEFAGANSAYVSTAISLNEWHHVLYIKTPGSIRTTSTFYVDGADLGAMNASSSNSTPAISTNPFHLGRWANYGFNYFNGLADDVAIYNRAPTAGEARLLAIRRGIAYELAPRPRRYAAQAAASSRLLNLRRRSVLC